MKMTVELYICAENKRHFFSSVRAFSSYKQLRPDLRKAFTQVVFRDYLERNGFNSVREFTTCLRSKERHRYNAPHEIDTGRFYSELESNYWYKLARGQIITNRKTIFCVDDAIGLLDLLGLSHPFWKLLNRSINVCFSAYLLPIELRKQIFIHHNFHHNLSPEKFSNNIKRQYLCQLEKLYAYKSIDSLHALTLLCIGYDYRDGDKQSKKAEKYLYAQFLYLMMYKYKIEKIFEVFVYMKFLLECNSLYKNKVEEALNIDQLEVDLSVVQGYIQSTRSLPKIEQENIISRKIITYLSAQPHHPYFRIYENKTRTKSTKH